MKLICAMDCPCPHQKNLDGSDECVKNEGDCEYQIMIGVDTGGLGKQAGD